MLELILLVVIVAIFLINRKSKFTQNTYYHLDNSENPSNLDDDYKLDTTEFVVSKDCCATQYKPMCGKVNINDEREIDAFDAGSGCDLNDVHNPKVTSDMINTNFFSTGSTEATNSGCLCATKKSFDFLSKRGQI